MQNLLIHVWTNLIDNAVKFSSRGTEIIIRLRKTGDCVNFEIKNKGPVIPKHYFEKVFTKFFQCDTSRKSEGNGLGLALAKRIVDDSAGHIHVKSSDETETVFEVILPLNTDRYDN